jgi:hypothetical protein
LYPACLQIKFTAFEKLDIGDNYCYLQSYTLYLPCPRLSLRPWLGLEFLPSPCLVALGLDSILFVTVDLGLAIGQK